MATDHAQRLIAGTARTGLTAAAWPIRRLGHVRTPAVAAPDLLHPAAPPPTEGRLLVLFDGDCGICLHFRDVFGALDRRDRLAFDRIARHANGLLADLSDEQRDGSWHVIHPDGSREERGAGLATVVAALPGGRVPAGLMRRFPRAVDASYRWFVRHRATISQASGLRDHPERGPG